MYRELSYIFVDNMNPSFSYNITTLGVGLILSIAILGAAYTAGNVFGVNTFVERLLEMDLEKLKQKTAFKLEKLWQHYRETNGVDLPQGLSFKDVVENEGIFEEHIKEQILGLKKIYFDLISNGTSSIYFVHILETYGNNIVGM
uniref:Orf143 n=1 Tax=Batis maritima TaxID=4436 RepID=A0A068BBV1_BATMA|nr:orf143 [Batis maritima]AIC83395.1 orf143 [Batis maritima]